MEFKQKIWVVTRTYYDTNGNPEVDPVRAFLDKQAAIDYCGAEEARSRLYRYDWVEVELS